MEHGQSYLDGGFMHFFLDSYWNSPSIILNGYRHILVYGNNNFITKSCHGFVYTIIHYFIYQVVKPANTGTSYIHTGAFTHRLQSLQYLDLGFIIIVSISLLIILHH